MLLLPLSVLAGGALFWPAACLVAIDAALDRRHGAMLVWYGLAVGFDAQALLLAPFVFAVAIAHRLPPRLLAVAPLAAMAMLLARSPDSASLHLSPAFATTGGAPNLWALAQVAPWIGALPLTGLALAAAMGAAVAYVAWFSARPLARSTLLDAALLCALVVPGLWPALDARGFLLADVLAPMIALLTPKPGRWRVALLVLAGSLVAFAGGESLAPVGAVAMLAATLLHARAVLVPAANDDPLMARAA